jgi:hypothetical protein
MDPHLSQNQTRPGHHRPADPRRSSEREAQAIRAPEGIPLLKSVVDDLLAISKKTGVPFEINWAA